MAWPGVAPAFRTQRGIGIADLAYAVVDGRPPRASGELAIHVVDVLSALEASAAAGRRVDTRTTCDRPQPLRPAVQLSAAYLRGA